MFDKVLKFQKKVDNGICPIKKVDNPIFYAPNLGF